MLPNAFGDADQERLIRRGYVKIQRTRLGHVILLGRRGRSVLGFDPDYTSPPHSACNHVLIRYAKSLLERGGYTFTGKPARNLFTFEDEDSRVYLTGVYPCMSKRAMRRVINTMASRLEREDSTLIVATAKLAQPRLNYELLHHHIQIQEVDIPMME